jgi:transposase
MADFCYMGLLRILTNSLCTLGARPQLPHVYPDSTGIRIFPLAKRFGVDSTEAMIRPGFLDPESRRDLIELARDGLAAHRLARRANALVLLDDGMNCAAVAKVLLLDDDTIRTWYRLYQDDGIEGLAGFGYEGGVCRLSDEQQAKLKAWVGETLPRSTRAIGAWIEQQFGITYEGRSGLIALLHRLELEFRKPTVIARKLDPAQQAAFIKAYEQWTSPKRWRDRIRASRSACIVVPSMLPRASAGYGSPDPMQETEPR